LYLKLFVKRDCPKCPAAKEVVKEFPGAVEIYDIDQVEGLAEAAYYSVQCTPSILVVDDAGVELRAWRCEVPSPREILAAAN
jgi:glutaredoxin